MKLQIDTSQQKLVKVAIIKDKRLIKSVQEANEHGSQVLLPLIIKLLTAQGLALKDLTEIEVFEGPGSYTGLRVGASVAQALGFALNIPVNNQLNTPIKLRYT